MNSTKGVHVLLLITALLTSSSICHADITVALTKGFVRKYKDKATIPTTFNIDKHHNHPNPIGSGSDDGDIHIAGRDSVVRLPMVAEIINGAKETTAMDFLLQSTPGQEIPLTGVWRLWFEHPGSEDQIQGEDVSVPKNTNPDHIFEFHPVVKFGSFDVLNSFAPIKADDDEEFTGYAAEKAFDAYEKRPGTITKSKTAIMITSNKAGFNYAEFQIRLAGKPKDVGDGYLVFATVYNAKAKTNDDPVVEESRRMVFVKGTQPADKVKDLKKGDKLHVLGIPRVNLNLVYAIATGLEDGEEYSEGLPYEMIIVAVLQD
ncbi:MAG TPA: hypothetical protein VHS05_12825 [Pyrinomonadaceae bacterium]|nr:hypothetical protein [Pyrinomonadaceae bacterium]